MASRTPKLGVARSNRARVTIRRAQSLVTAERDRDAKRPLDAEPIAGHWFGDHVGSPLSSRILCNRRAQRCAAYRNVTCHRTRQVVERGAYAFPERCHVGLARVLGRRDPIA